MTLSRERLTNTSNAIQQDQCVAWHQEVTGRSYIEQVPANILLRKCNKDTSLLQHLLRADAGTHKDMRCGNRPRAKNYFFAGVDDCTRAICRLGKFGTGTNELFGRAGGG